MGSPKNCLLLATTEQARQRGRGCLLAEELERPVVDADGIHLEEQLRAG